MTATIAFLFGILLGAIVLAIVGRGKPTTSRPTPTPTALGWCTLSLGLVAITAFAGAAVLTPSGGGLGPSLSPISIAFALAAVVVGLGTLRKHDRHWPTWVGLAAGVAPAVAWSAFAAAYVLGFGD